MIKEQSAMRRSLDFGSNDGFHKEVTFKLKPEERVKINQAKLVFWSKGEAWHGSGTRTRLCG